MTTTATAPFTGNGLPVLIGSLPLEDHGQALEWIMAATPEIPLWPQLPHDPLEQMMPQFAPAIPCISEENPASPQGRILFDTSRAGFEEEMLAFYEDYLAALEDPALLDASSRFALRRERAAGFFLFLDRIKGRQGLRAVKGQVTGPFTMLTGIKDQAGRAGYFDDTIRDMVIKGIGMQAAWQARTLAAAAPVPVLIFIDEPALAGLGSSAFIGVTADEIREMINEVAGAIHQQGGLAGIHVCANTDWPILLRSEIDILSFDAHGYFDRLAPLTGDVGAFLDRGSIIAWGGVPTSGVEAIGAETTDSLRELYNRQMRVFANGSRDLAALLRQSLITPSCGTGSLAPDLARRVLDLTRDTAAALRRQHR